MCIKTFLSFLFVVNRCDLKQFLNWCPLNKSNNNKNNRKRENRILIASHLSQTFRYGFINLCSCVTANIKHQYKIWNKFIFKQYVASGERKISRKRRRRRNRLRKHEQTNRIQSVKCPVGNIDQGSNYKCIK